MAATLDGRVESSGAVFEAKRLYDDADLWQQLSVNGHQAFQDKFSLTAGAHKVLAVVDALVANAGGADAL
jgi:hypothetical protein